MKEKILNALRQLIETYSNDTIEHSLQSCPLCMAYHSSHNYQGSASYKDTCGNCLNLIFDNGDPREYSCLQRTISFSKLNWLNKGNNQNLSNFWSEVYDVLILESEEDILGMSESFKSQLLSIAEKYK